MLFRWVSSLGHRRIGPHRRRRGPGPGEDPGVRLPGILLGDDDLILALGEAVARVGPLAHDALVRQQAQVQGRHRQVVLHGQRRADDLIEGRRGRHAVLLHAAVRGRQVIRESAVRPTGEAGVGHAGQEDHVRLVRLQRTGGVRQGLGHQRPVHGPPERLAVAFRGGDDQQPLGAGGGGRSPAGLQQGQAAHAHAQGLQYRAAANLPGVHGSTSPAAGVLLRECITADDRHQQLAHVVGRVLERLLNSFQRRHVSFGLLATNQVPHELGRHAGPHFVGGRQRGHQLDRVLELRRRSVPQLQHAAGVDGQFVVRGHAVAADAVVVLEGEPDRIEQPVAGGASVLQVLARSAGASSRPGSAA